MVILTHPCAGKTYWARKDERVQDPKTNQNPRKGYVFVTLDHRSYDSYDAAVVVPDERLMEFIDRRNKTQNNKRYTTHEAISEYRERVFKYAKKHNIPINNSIEEVIND